MSNKILVIGRSGQLASCLQQIANDDFFFVGRPILDITDTKYLTNFIDNFAPKLIINSAAFTAVDLAEQQQDLAYQINDSAVEAISIACKAHDIPLIHISTDYVFDGTKKSPYTESDITNPMSIYGKSKLAGEEKIKQYLTKHVIIRTSWLFSSYGSNFIKTMIHLAKTRSSLNVVDDQMGCPTSANNLSQIIVQIANEILQDTQNVNYGVYHYCDTPMMSWYNFANIIFSILSSEYKMNIPLVNRISSQEFASPAPRPANSVLDCSLINQNFHIKQQNWLEELKICIKNIM